MDEAGSSIFLRTISTLGGMEINQIWSKKDYFLTGVNILLKFYLQNFLCILSCLCAFHRCITTSIPFNSYALFF